MIISVISQHRGQVSVQHKQQTTMTDKIFHLVWISCTAGLICWWSKQHTSNIQMLRKSLSSVCVDDVCVLHVSFHCHHNGGHLPSAPFITSMPTETIAQSQWISLTCKSAFFLALSVCLSPIALAIPHRICYLQAMFGWTCTSEYALRR